jgi:hypothetical protein
VSFLRRRELERRLCELARRPTPEPPAGLAERIRAEIPDELAVPAARTGDERPRSGSTAARGWRVHRWRLAAALVMTVAAGSALWWVRRGEEPAVPPRAALGRSAAAKKAEAPPATAEGATAPDAMRKAVPAPPRTAVVPEPAPTFGGEATGSAKAGTAGAAPRRAPVPGTTVPSPPAENEAAAAPPPPARRIPPATLDAAAAAPERRREDWAGKLAAPSEPAAQPAGEGAPGAAAEAQAGGAPEPPDAPAGDPLAPLRRDLAAGRLPPPEAVSVDGLLDAFASGDPRPAGAAPFAVAADGGPPALDAVPGERLLRFHVGVREGREGSAAAVEVEIDGRRVAAARRLGGGALALAGDRFRDRPGTAGLTSAAGLTFVYAVELRPGAAPDEPSAPLATLTLRWRPVPGVSAEPRRDLRLDLRFSAVAADWERATPPFRLASLAAAFAERLREPLQARAFAESVGEPARAAGAFAALAERARRLAAGGLAGDPRAAELARLTALAAAAGRSGDAAGGG